MTEGQPELTRVVRYSPWKGLGRVQQHVARRAASQGTRREALQAVSQGLGDAAFDMLLAVLEGREILVKFMRVPKKGAPYPVWMRGPNWTRAGRYYRWPEWKHLMRTQRRDCT